MSNSSIIFDNSGFGDPSGTLFDNNTPTNVSYNTIGAAAGTNGTASYALTASFAMNGGGGGSLTVVGGATVTGVTTLTFSGGTVSGTTPNATVTISGGASASYAASASVAISSSYAYSSSIAISSSYAYSSSVAVSASYSYSSSIAVSSSYALTATSASYALSSSVAVSSSYALNASTVLSASYAVNSSTSANTTSVDFTGIKSLPAALSGSGGYGGVSDVASLTSNQASNSLINGMFYNASSAGGAITITLDAATYFGFEFTVFASNLTNDISFMAGAGQTIISADSNLKINKAGSSAVAKYITGSTWALIGDLKV